MLLMPTAVSTICPKNNCDELDAEFNELLHFYDKVLKRLEIYSV